MTHIVLTLTLLAATPLAGGDERPLALHKLEQELAKDIAAKMAPLDARYRQALDKLLADFTKAGDLESLLAVKAEIVRLENARAQPAAPGSAAKPPAKPALRPSPSGAYTLRPPDATPAGGVRPTPGGKSLAGWKGSGTASWSLAGIAPGEYAVRLDYHAGPFAGGRLKLLAGAVKKEFAITGSGKWDDPKSLDLGTLTLSGENHIVLAVLEARAVGIMEFRALVLTPHPPTTDNPK